MQSVHRQDDLTMYYINMTNADIKKMVGINLERIRNEHKLKTQEALARLIDSSANLINAIENGKRGLGYDLMTRICNALNIHPSEFYRENTDDINKPVSIPSNCIADPVCQKICSTCMNTHPEDKEAFVILSEIMDSGDKEGIIKAIKQNLEQFRRLVPKDHPLQQNQRIPDLKTEGGTGGQKIKKVG